MLPKIPKGFVTNFPGAIPTFIGPRQFIFLLCSVTAFFLISFFFLDINFQYQLQFSRKGPNINFNEINYPNEVTKKWVIAKIDSANKEKNDQQSFSQYSQVFDSLVSIYVQDHDPESRDKIKIFSQFLASEFPSLYKAENFEIPCLDSSCAIPNNPAEILEIMDELGKITSIDQQVAMSVKNKFEAAALSQDANYQFDNYLNALQEISGEYRRVKDSQIAKVANMLKEFIKANYGQFYGRIEIITPELLEI